MRPLRAAAVALIGASLLSACGDAVTTDPPGAELPPGDVACTSEPYESTFEAIQELVFERHGCTDQVCHGSAAAAGLDLRSGSALDALVGVPSTGSALPRVAPGSGSGSFLYRKLAAATLPGRHSDVPGTPMPSGLPALSEAELEAVRLWIYAGAAATGTAPGTDGLLDACLPPVEPVPIDPLDAPGVGEGVQFELPPWTIEPGGEQEVCFAIYYDVSDQVPPEALDPTGEYYRVGGQEVRQAAGSHHMTIIHSGVDVARIDDSAFGTWTCAAGGRSGEPCDPLDSASCPGSICRSEMEYAAAGCVGYGPLGTTGDLSPVFEIMGGGGSPYIRQDFPSGVFAQYPVRGIAYWNSHAFNPTVRDVSPVGRINFYFASEQRLPMQAIFTFDSIFLPDAAPFTTQTVCADHVLPQGTRLFGLTSHTHKHGRHFWAELPDGSRVYESFTYDEPVRRNYDPPFAFDSADPADRTIHYCGIFNNGVGADGEPDTEAVTRASRIAVEAIGAVGECEPIACVNDGAIGRQCSGSSDHVTCDTSPGAGDGLCDACRITGGETTENEMFVLMGQHYVDRRYPQPDLDGPVFAGGL